MHKQECKNLQKTIKQYYERQTEAARIRSRVKNFEEGEKSTKYFFNLEKRNISNKTWTRIKCKDGNYKNDIQSILKEQKIFFEELFRSEGTNDAEAKSLLKCVDAKLTEDEKMFCEKDVTQEEIHKVIKLLKNNKSPGDDGIIGEFYQNFWYLIHDELTQVIKFALENKSLSKSQYNAIITLLYKKGDREEITNLRPISLMNTDYKIITKILAERLKLFLPRLIHSDQKGFVNGRNISEANRLIQDLIEYADQNNLNASIIFIDYMKAFDRVEWDWTLKCLENFNFGIKFRSWIVMIFKNAKTSILTNGFRTNYFKISRSMRQGCPISPLLYILQAEPLACAIRKNESIIGIPLPHIYPETGKQAEVKIVSYVDDSQFFNCSEESITETFKITEKFEKASGAKIHKHKTVGLYLGAWKNKTPSFNDISWTKTNVKILGINHGYEINETAVWMDKVNKIKSCIQIWKSRDLSYIGKVLIIKSLLVSQIGYLADIKPVPNNILKQIESLIWNFLWNNKQPLVNRRTMNLNYNEGGVKMLNLRDFIESKNIQFMYRILSSDYENWNIIGKNWLKYLDSEYNINYFVCKCSSIKGLDLSVLPEYYKLSIASWVRFQSMLCLKDKDSILSSCLFGNKYITLRNTPLFIRSFSRSNIKMVRDIWDTVTNNFHQHESIRNRLYDTTSWRAKYNKIKSSFSADILNILRGEAIQNEQPKFTINHDLTIFKDSKALDPKKLKLKLIQYILQDTLFERKYQTKWETAFNQSFNWKQIWLINYELPVCNKLKDFQWKIVHNAIFTEHKLLLMNMSDDGFCHFCKSNLETIAHLFDYCRRTNWIVNQLEQKINRVLENDSRLAIKIAPYHFILGFTHENSIVRVFVNLIIILVKWEMWKIRNKIKFDNIQVTNRFLLEHTLQKIRTAINFLEKTSIAFKYDRQIRLWKLFA